MNTSAGIGLHREEDLARGVTRAMAIESAVRALVGGGLALIIAAVCGLGFAFADTEVKATCNELREQEGYGRHAALTAMDDPEVQKHFLYRVDREPDGYRVLVVARDGAWLGDTWERDALGRARHITDVCADRIDRRWGPILGLAP